MKTPFLLHIKNATHWAAFLLSLTILMYGCNRRDVVDLDSKNKMELTPEPSLPSVEHESTTGTRRTGRLADPNYRARRMEELRAEDAAAQERARRWAEQTGSPMRIETNDTVMILIDYTEERGPIYRTTLQNQE